MLKTMSVEHSISIQQIRDTLGTCPFDPHMIKILNELHKDQGAIHIISDANTMFIETILEHNGVGECVTSIISNPAKLTKENEVEYLHITKLCGEVEESKHGCTTCPINMCKGEIVDKLVKEKDPNGITVYVGDGGNDYCAVRRLDLNYDFVFARKGFVLEKKLKNDHLLDNDHVFLWNDWKELYQLFVSNGLINS